MAASDLARLIAAHFDGGAGPLGLAVSGGGDSMAMLHLMAAWRGAPLACVTVNHHLREAAAGEAAMVADVCATLDIPHDVLDWDAGAATGNLHAAARRARYDLMAAWARERGLSGIVLAHARGDVAETLLMRLARRAGVDGLAAMAPRRDWGGITLHRPLLGASREDLRAHLRAVGAPWCEDPSNDDPRYRRSLARRALAELAPIELDEAALADVAQHLAEARGTLAHYAAAESARVCTADRGDLLIEGAPLMALRADMARRILQAGLGWITGTPHMARGPELARLMARLAEGRGGTLAGVRLTQEPGRIRLAREFAAIDPGPVGAGHVWDNRWCVSGPDAPGAVIAALGPEGRRACPDWRESGLPAPSIDASPAVWRGGILLAAPLAGAPKGWSAQPCRDARDLHSALLSH